jgi:putative membrane protein
MKNKTTNWFKFAFQFRGSVISAIYQRVIGFGVFSFIVSVLYYFKLPVSQPVLGSIIPSIVLGALRSPSMVRDYPLILILKH